MVCAAFFFLFSYALTQRLLPACNGLRSFCLQGPLAKRPYRFALCHYRMLNMI
ncbi:hypothetical protein AcetOrient_orf01652 [Acetobacter orientalis]|uniref:Uncharacterized protein n=1 Tax=Acetobacter orientalis TaxID=146474 RepID=A0A2Z5ZFU2_9PROT|nr:hypothetical protein AcetOrient_orf01652 [Acetobacter orientalis]